MALPFLNNGSRRKLDQILAIDLGCRFTKVVHMQNRGGEFTLCGYSMLDAPIFEKTLSPSLLRDHLTTLSQSIPSKVKQVALTINVNEAVVRHVEMPPMRDEDIRSVLKLNSRAYLQQDLPGYIFDHFIPPKTPSKAGDPGKLAPGQKQQILVAGAKSQLIDDYVTASRGAGFIPTHIVPSIIGPVNAFENTLPQIFSTEVIALIDIGFKSSSISILKEGELILNRVITVGGDKLTSGLSDSMNISYAEAEGIKIGMPSEVEKTLEGLLTPLGRELRASIDFFEHQQDRTVSQVFVSGGSARSEFILQILRQELMLECSTWNPTTALKHTLSPQQSAELDQIAPQLAVAVGTALTVL